MFLDSLTPGCAAAGRSNQAFIQKRGDAAGSGCARQRNLSHAERVQSEKAPHRPWHRFPRSSAGRTPSSNIHCITIAPLRCLNVGLGECADDGARTEEDNKLFKEECDECEGSRCRRSLNNRQYSSETRSVEAFRRGAACSERRGSHWYSAVSEVSNSALVSMSPLVSSTRVNLLHPLISTWIF